MSGREALLVAVGLALLGSAGCRSPYYADRGAALGGVLGATTGAVIGNQQGKSGVGALIGGAAGALAGAAIGDSIDADVARSQAIIQERMGRQLTGAVTPQDVVAMTQYGIGDDVIVTHIRANGVSQPPSASDIIWLHQQGVSEVVINAMHHAPPPQTAVRVAGPPPPVIIEEHYYGPPPPWYYHRPYGYHRRAPPPRVSWGVSFGR